MEILRQLLKSEKPLRWVFTGDSITHACCWTLGARSYVQLFEEMLRSDLWRIKDCVINTGVSGWDTNDLIVDLDQHVIQLQPDVVSIMIGMNDVGKRGIEGVDAFEGNYRKIIGDIRTKTDAHLILHTPNPVTPGVEPKREEALTIYSERIRVLAQDLNIPVIDHDRHWKKAWAENERRGNMWMGNHVHPNEFGHRAFAYLMFKELGIWDESALSCRLFVP